MAKGFSALLTVIRTFFGRVLSMARAVNARRKRLFSKMDAAIDRYGEEIEENSQRQLPYSQLFRKLLRDLGGEARKLPREGFLLLTSIVTVFGFLDFIGYDSNATPIKLVLYEMGKYQDIAWKFLLEPLRLEPGPLAKYLFTLQIMFCIMNVRGAEIARAADANVVKLNTVHDQKKYLALIWLFICLALFVWFAFLVLSNVSLNPPESGGVSLLRYWVALISTTLAILSLLFLLSLALFFAYIPYYKFIYQQRPLKYARQLAERSPVRFLCLNLVYILGMCVFIFAMNRLAQSVDFITVGMRNGALALGLALYLSVWSIAFFAAISVPRVLMAVLAVAAILVTVDQLLPAAA